MNASNKTHKFLLNQLKDKQIFQIYKKFEKDLKLNNNFIVAVSGGQTVLLYVFYQKFIQLKKI